MAAGSSQRDKGGHTGVKGALVESLEVDSSLRHRIKITEEWKFSIRVPHAGVPTPQMR